MKKSFLLFLIGCLALSAHSQLSVSKMIGKGSKIFNPGLGVFVFYDFPLNDEGNNSLMLELLEFQYYGSRDKSLDESRGYVSIKLGYRHIFSESKTGFYIEPEAGYTRVVYISNYLPDNSYGDGVAVALETGYNLEVGQRGNSVNFGLKYENDMGAKKYHLQSIGLHIGYAFSWLRKKR